MYMHVSILTSLSQSGTRRPFSPTDPSPQYRIARSEKGTLSLDGRISMMRRLNTGDLPVSGRRTLVQHLPGPDRGRRIDLFA